MLSHEERHELDKIERSLELSDPALATALTRGEPTPRHRVLTALAITLDLAAAAFLIAGLITTSPALTLAALLSAGTGVALHIATGHSPH